MTELPPRNKLKKWRGKVNKEVKQLKVKTQTPKSYDTHSINKDNETFSLMETMKWLDFGLHHVPTLKILPDFALGQIQIVWPGANPNPSWEMIGIIISALHKGSWRTSQGHECCDPLQDHHAFFTGQYTEMWHMLFHLV